MINQHFFKPFIMHTKILVIVCISIILSTSFATEPNIENTKTVLVPVFSKETNKDFDDIVEDLQVIIGEHNFRLNQHARIGKAISERVKKPYHNATVLHFCNLGYAKELLDLAPDYLLRMPCRISIWQRADKRSVIEVWLLPEDDKRTTKFAKKINTILREIVTYGAN